MHVTMIDPKSTLPIAVELNITALDNAITWKEYTRVVGRITCDKAQQIAWRKQSKTSVYM